MALPLSLRLSTQLHDLQHPPRHWQTHSFQTTTSHPRTADSAHLPLPSATPIAAPIPTPIPAPVSIARRHRLAATGTHHLRLRRRRRRRHSRSRILVLRRRRGHRRTCRTCRTRRTRRFTAGPRGAHRRRLHAGAVVCALRRAGRGLRAGRRGRASGGEESRLEEGLGGADDC